MKDIAGKLASLLINIANNCFLNWMHFLPFEDAPVAIYIMLY